MTVEISAPLAASEPAMTRIAWISGSAATASRACGRSARDSARNAIMGVPSRGLAAVATEMRSGRSRSTHAALSAGVPSPNCAHWSTAETRMPAAERDHAHAPASRRPGPRLPTSRSETSTSSWMEWNGGGGGRRGSGVHHAILTDERAGVGLRRPGAGRSSRPALIRTTGFRRSRAASSARTSFVLSAVPSR